MTPTEAEALFIQLWNAGTETAEIARRLGIPHGTAQSRAHRLQQRGLISLRPKGGNYPSQKALARQAGTPAPPAPPAAPAPQVPPAPPRPPR
jgi:transposase